MKTEKVSTLRFGGLFTAKPKATEMYRPNELKASAEAWICLNCPLPECNKVKCTRYETEIKNIKGERRNGRI